MLAFLVNFVFCAIVMIAVPVIVSLEYYYFTKTKVSAVSSLPWMRRAVVKVLKNHGPQPQDKAALKIYELGSGWGALAVDAARLMPAARITGIELSPVPAWFSMARAKLFGHKNISIVKGDFFKADLRDADIVVLYMLESVLLKLKPKFEAELKPGAIVVSNTFRVEGWTPAHVETVTQKIIPLHVYLYKIPECFTLERA